jgi:formylglycine-generating enzyme required for sulfatase activity
MTKLQQQNSSYRVLRGGCWCYVAAYCRAAYRIWVVPGWRNSLYGFRPVAGGGE